MLDGRPLIDVHLHAARRPTVKLDWQTTWLAGFDSPEVEEVYDQTGTIRPDAFDRLLAAGSDRVRFAANINPHLHYPVADELQRQLELGAIALKVHPVHGGFPANDRALYPAYELCQAAGLPVVVHCGTSTFPGALNQFADPVLLDDVLRDFRSLQLVLAHGGRGWWYDAAAFLALTNPNVW